MQQYAETSLPAFIDVRDRSCLVTGGDKLAQDAALHLVEYGARVTLVTNDANPAITIMGDTGIVDLEIREFEESDLDDKWLVVAAYGDEDLDAKVAKAAHAQARICAVPAFPKHASLEFPPTVRRDPLQIALSTNGISTYLEEKYKKELEETYGAVYTDYTDLIGEVKDVIRDVVAGTEEDRQEYYRMIYDSDLFERLQDGEYMDGQDVYVTYVKPHIDDLINKKD